jgi:hypothetical protein
VRILPGLHGRVRVQRPCYALAAYHQVIAAFLKVLESRSSRKLSQLFKVKADLIVQLLAPFGQAIRLGNGERLSRSSQPNGQGRLKALVMEWVASGRESGCQNGRLN